MSKKKILEIREREQEIEIANMSIIDIVDKGFLNKIRKKWKKPTIVAIIIDCDMDNPSSETVFGISYDSPKDAKNRIIRLRTYNPDTQAYILSLFEQILGGQ